MLNKTLLGLLVIFLPAMAHAQIYSSVRASSNTGGNVVGPGGKVTTGDESASIQVVSNISSSNTSTIEIKTNVNGAVREEAVTAPGPVSVIVEAVPERTTIQVEGAEDVEKAMPQAGLGARIALLMQNFFASLLGWLR